ncbi:MAG: sprT domain-containing protein [Hyphomicrobiales bacterium]|nr:sprT domain-containing protein [Hyphomicrobiales bacterium]MCP5372052.1 sprT domain-containing protein [Hyphomicrobiales bacterium]
MPNTQGTPIVLQPTTETYEAFQYAYDHFGWTLFDAMLPGCLITLQRRPRSSGFFAPARFVRGDATRCDEIAMNPAHFQLHTDEFTLSILVHEMAHQWQEHFGTPGRGRYHNRQWADKMIALGLHPSDTGAAEGRETGDRMAHYTVEGGPFEQAAKSLLDSGFSIPWRECLPKKQGTDGTPEEPGSPRDKGGQRVKYTCPVCGLNAWSRHDAGLTCTEHGVPMSAAK